MDLQEHVNESFRKIGRNLYLFQMLEQMLKHIISTAASGCVEDLIQHREKTQLKTLGQLISAYHAKADSSHSEERIEDEELMKGVYFSVSASCFGDSSFIDAKKAELEQLVLDRNELAHHLLPQFDINSIDSCTLLDRKLDKQREDIIEAINHLKPLYLSLIDIGKLLHDLVSTGELDRQLRVASLAHHEAIRLLCDISAEARNTNGWLPLNMAGRRITEDKSEELTLLKKESGHKTLKQLMIATDLFEFREEPTKKGVRQLYRVKAT